MRWRARSALTATTLAATLLAGCRARTESARPLPTRAHGAEGEAEAGVYPELPPRWTIDGATIAEQPLPSAMARSLRHGGYEPLDVQDYLLVDLNGDGRRDAVALLVSIHTPGGFEALALLSEGEAFLLRPLAEIEAEIYALSVVPLVDGPSLIAAAPRPGACDQGPSWSFARVTGTLVEPVGRLAIEPYDCAVAEGEIAFERDASGAVAAVISRHGAVETRYRWDASTGSFTVAGSPE